jgi:hypothetical protein
MSELKIKTWSIPSADLGSENPLPPLLSNQELHIAQSVDPAVPGEIRQNMTYGHLPNILPYAMQDGYGRFTTILPNGNCSLSTRFFNLPIWR